MRGEIVDLEDLALERPRPVPRVARPVRAGRRGRVDYSRPRLTNWVIFAALAAFWSAVVHLIFT
jgi:hypothetical protein